MEPKHNQRTVLRARPDLIKELTLQVGRRATRLRCAHKVATDRTPS